VGEPDRVFDPAAWKRMGTGAVRSVRVKTSQIAFEPGTLQKLGIVSNFRGKASMSADIGPGLDTVQAKLDVVDLHGGAIAQPVATHVTARIDQRNARCAVSVNAKGLEIMRAQAETPLTIDKLRADPKAARATPLHATIEFPHIDAKRLAAVLGNEIGRASCRE